MCFSFSSKTFIANIDEIDDKRQKTRTHSNIKDPVRNRFVSFHLMLRLALIHMIVNKFISTTTVDMSNESSVGSCAA